MDDQTIIRPTPGGRRPQRGTGQAAEQPQPHYPPQQPVAMPPPVQQPVYAPRPEAQPQGNHYQQAPVTPMPAYQAQPPYEQQYQAEGVVGDDNPLLVLVAPLLAFTSKIQSVGECPNLDEYHRYSLDQLNYYRSQGWGLNADPNTAHHISYAICSLIDEIVLNTPWGSTSQWTGDSMLINLHQEAWGGENFFHYLQELMQRPATNLLVLEFYYCCLSLGFEGKYRRLANGRRELDQLRSELYIMISRHRDREPKGLSPAWLGLDMQHRGFVRHLPQWVVWSLAAFLMAASFIGFNWYLNQQSDQVMGTLARIGQAETLQVTPGNLDKLNRFIPAEKPVLDFQRLDLVGILTPPLQPEIDSGVIELIDDADHTRVRIRHSKLFASGQSAVSPRFIPLLERIAEHIPELTAPVEVQGHSDNVPIFSARFPSNWVLSKARADAVGEILKTRLPADLTLRTEGMADSEPLVPNTSSENRALNRRVEIVLRK